MKLKCEYQTYNSNVYQLLINKYLTSTTVIYQHIKFIKNIYDLSIITLLCRNTFPND